MFPFWLIFTNITIIIIGVCCMYWVLKRYSLTIYRPYNINRVGNIILSNGINNFTID